MKTNLSFEPSELLSLETLRSWLGEDISRAQLIRAAVGFYVEHIDASLTATFDRESVRQAERSRALAFGFRTGRPKGTPMSKSARRKLDLRVKVRAVEREYAKRERREAREQAQGA